MGRDDAHDRALRWKEQPLKHMESEAANVDWSACPLVESRPNVQSGSWVLRGTRMPVEAIINNYQAGEDEAGIAEMFELPIGKVTEVLAFAARSEKRC
jgi:uncharacterized protein (DUF433 family)